MKNALKLITFYNYFNIDKNFTSNKIKDLGVKYIGLGLY